MGILILAVLTGSIVAVATLISGYGIVTALAMYVLAGLSSILFIALPFLGLCALRKRYLMSKKPGKMGVNPLPPVHGGFEGSPPQAR